MKEADDKNSDEMKEVKNDDKEPVKVEIKEKESESTDTNIVPLENVQQTSYFTSKWDITVISKQSTNGSGSSLSKENGKSGCAFYIKRSIPLADGVDDFNSRWETKKSIKGNLWTVTKKLDLTKTNNSDKAAEEKTETVVYMMHPPDGQAIAEQKSKIPIL